jgi:hypothetical protein
MIYRAMFDEVEPTAMFPNLNCRFVCVVNIVRTHTKQPILMVRTCLIYGKDKVATIGPIAKTA